MDFRLQGVPRELFADLFDLSDAELREHGSIRRIARPDSIFPCRVSLQEAAPGEEVVLTNFAHLPAPTSPYRSIGPVFVRRAAQQTWDRINDVPDVLRRRPLSLRAYDAEHMIIAAEAGPGPDLAAMVDRLFAHACAVYIHVHHAAYGCYHARIDRV
jgi:hypothetical protein